MQACVSKLRRESAAILIARNPPLPRNALCPEPGFDLLSGELRRNPYPYYRYLRDELPIAFIARHGWYAVTRHEDVERVLRSHAEFSSSIMRSADRALLGQDPPSHTRVRRILSRLFEVTRRPAFEEWIERTARSLISRFVKAGGGDFVRDVAVDLPLLVTAHLLGTGEDRLNEFKEWSEAVVLGASRMIPPGQEAKIKERAERFDRYFADLIRRRREQPPDQLRGSEDIVSALLQAPEACELEEQDVRSLAKLLLIAGNETATNLMSNAMLAMFMTAELEERLRQEPQSCRAWVEETLRFDAPVQIILRRTQRDMELHGALIPEGHVVAAFLGSANRDERHHPDPDAFRLHRPQPHLAFGTGPHFCLGASLARLEATIVLSILIEETRHFEAIDCPAEIPRITALQLRGPQRLRMLVS
jgi:cytochrome P450